MFSTFPDRIGLALFLVFISYPFQIQGIVQSRTEEICKNEEYLTPTEGPVTCCSMQTLNPGISYDKFWEQCATPDDSETMVNVTLWRIYACMVKKALDGKPLNLENFAEDMSKDYPEDKKRIILDNARANPQIFKANETELEKLIIIRRKYYQIELEACSTNSSSIKEKIRKYKSYENVYMRGGECLNNEVPIDPNYYPLAREEDVLATWTSILEMVSINDNKTYGAQIHRACEITSSWLAQEISTTDELFQKPNYDNMFNRLKPKWANAKITNILRTKVKEYWDNGFAYKNNNSTTLDEHMTKEMTKFYEQSLKKEFVDIRDESKAKALMFSCLIPTFMKTSFAETFSYVICRLPSPKKIHGTEPVSA